MQFVGGSMQFATDELAASRRAEVERKRTTELVLEQITNLVKAPRNGGGFGGKVGRADVASLLAAFALCSDEEACDDFWLELQNGGTTAYVESCENMSAALVARGARPIVSLLAHEHATSNVGGGVDSQMNRKVTMERLTSHTASSRIRTAALKSETNQPTRPLSARRGRTPSPDVHNRLAMPKKPAPAPSDTDAQLERERRECTFTPTISRAAAHAVTRFADPTYASAGRKTAKKTQGAD